MCYAQTAKEGRRPSLAVSANFLKLLKSFLRRVFDWRKILKLSVNFLKRLIYELLVAILVGYIIAHYFT